MAESFKINVEFRARSGFRIPERINVPLNSYIEWNVIDMDVNQSSRRFSNSGLKFQFYFRDRSPFDWKTQSATMLYIRPSSYGSGGMEYQLAPQIQLLAAGVAQERGEFKYGVRVFDNETNAKLHDDDPYLNVF